MEMIAKPFLQGFRTNSFPNLLFSSANVFLIVCGFGAMKARAQPQYAITELPPDSPSDGTGSDAVNGLGDVGGSLTPNLGDGIPTLWLGDQRVFMELPIGYASGSVDALNSNHLCIGFSSDQTKSLYWDNFEVFVLGVLPGATNSFVEDINESGQIVGYSGDTILGEPPDHAFVWKDGVFEDLGVPVGYRSSYGYGINNLADTVGRAYLIDSSVYHAVSNSQRRWAVLPLPPGEVTSRALEINDLGAIVGYSGNAVLNAKEHAVLWENGEAIVLPSLDGYPQSEAYSINNLGQIVGRAKADDGIDQVGVLWENNTVYRLLDLIPSDSGWTSLYGYDISDAGHIAGTGGKGEGGRAFLMTPIPEPCTADANGDKVVDPLDGGFVLSRFNCPVGTGDPACDAADVNTDGLVDPLDVGYVLSRFGACE